MGHTRILFHVSKAFNDLDEKLKTHRLSLNPEDYTELLASAGVGDVTIDRATNMRFFRGVCLKADSSVEIGRWFITDWSTMAPIGWKEDWPYPLPGKRVYEHKLADN